MNCMLTECIWLDFGGGLVHLTNMQFYARTLIFGTMVLGMLPAWADAPSNVVKSPIIGKTAKGTKKLPAPVLAALEKGDFVKLQSVVKSQLKEKQELSPTDTASQRLCMLHEWIRVTGAEVLTTMAKDDEQKLAFLQAFAKDAAWQEIYLSCGLVPYQTEVGMDVLYRIWCVEEGKVSNKPLAVALASCWGGGETWPNPPLGRMLPTKFNPVRRYQFFQKQEAEGRMHVNYPNLKAWELRFVVANPQQDWDDASYEFAAQNINMPWDKYDLSCWAATYTGTSKFGDSVQGGAYNLPFGDESEAERTLLNGGVCGAMSHLGAVAAMSHGIPAYTCGQPGHCAYAVRPERGKWIGGFGGPDGGMHNHIFGSEAPTSYHLMETVFADDATIQSAYRKSFCARALEAAGRLDEAEKMWRQALADSPLHPFFRAALHALMKQRGVSSGECYAYLMTDMLPCYVGHGMAAAYAMDDLAEVIAGMDDRNRLDIYRKQHEALSVTPGSWALKPDELVKKQSLSMSDDAGREKLLKVVFTEHMKRGDGTMFGQLLEWAVKTYTPTEAGSQLFNRSFAAAASEVAATAGQTGAADSDDRNKKMQEAYSKAIVAAEQARSAPAFQALVSGALALGEPDFKAPALQKRGALQGKVATGSLFRMSTSSNYDSPVLHAGIMTEAGGKCHTSSEKTPHVIVELAEPGFTTGCIIRKTDSHEGRMQKAVVYTSEDGATWFKRAEVDNMPKEWVAEFPEGVRAKWVKLEFLNDSANFAHITHFVTYTR